MNIFSNYFKARKVVNENDDYLYQTLNKHLLNVSNIAIDFDKDIGLENIIKLSALLHDIGKASKEFQNYLNDDEGARGSVIHSLQGAIYGLLINKKNNPILGELLSMVISAHHNQLTDGCYVDGSRKHNDIIKREIDEKLNFEEVLSHINTNKLEEVNEKASKEIYSVINRIKNIYQKNKYSAGFAIGLLVKYVYSCLVDADRYDAYLFANNLKYVNDEFNWNPLIKTFENNINGFNNDSDIAKIRNDISLKCKKAASKEVGIYELQVPTGGGKTLSSLRFALHHCEQHKKKRIIYVIPYLSIIEQTAKSIRFILNLNKECDIVLEHHSNIISPENDKESLLQKLAVSRWDNPIIITTMVQFLETVMSSRASKLRKFHNLANSVIIFDEIQSLPIKSIHLFNEVVSFLSKICNSTILLCSATQPLLAKTERQNLLLQDYPSLVSNTDEAFEKLKRTEIVIKQEKNIDEMARFIIDKAQKKGNCLTILNTKKLTKDVYEKVKSLNSNNKFHLYHLSTSMCSIHREDVFENIKKHLEEGNKIICVTTQLIEAGVDISFNCVVRSMAGLDSIAQAAGRCNRNGESESPQSVYVIPVKGENLDLLPDIKVGKINTLRITHENPNADLLSKETLDKYYEYYFFEQKHLMDYPTNLGQSIYRMLSDNYIGKKNYKNMHNIPCECYIAHAFRSADENYSVIAKNTESVIVNYKGVENLLARYNSEPKNIVTKNKIKIIRELEKYSVSLYNWELLKLDKERAITFLNEDSDDEKSGIKLLSKDYYSKETGVEMSVDLGPLIS